MHIFAKSALGTMMLCSSVAAAQAQDTYNPTLLDEELSIIENAAKIPELTTFVEALMASEIAAELIEGGDYTVFAPTNEAFEYLPDGRIDALLEPENADELAEILGLHVAGSPLRAEDLEAKVASAGPIETLQEDSALTVAEIEGQLHLQPPQGDQDAVAILIPDIVAANGVIHVINRVMIP